MCKDVVDEDEVQLVLQRTWRSARAVLVGMEKVVRTTDLTYVLSGVPSSVKVMASQVKFKVGK